MSTCSTPAEVWPKLTRQSVPSPPSDYARRLDRAVDVALTCCACVSAPKGRQPRRQQVCARRDALSSWREVRRPLPHRPGPSRSSTPDAFAPQARLDPPRGWSGLGVGSCPRLALRAAWSPSSSPSCALRADRARAAGGSTPHASPSRSREPPPPPLACPPRGAPPGLARPRPRRARLPTPAPRPRQIGSRGRRPCAGHNHYDATVPQ